MVQNNAYQLFSFFKDFCDFRFITSSGNATERNFVLCKSVQSKWYITLGRKWYFFPYYWHFSYIFEELCSHKFMCKMISFIYGAIQAIYLKHY
jgi:hypothetical protein